MTSLELVDSKKFNAFMDEAVTRWGGSDENKVEVIDELRGWLGDIHKLKPLLNTGKHPAPPVLTQSVALSTDDVLIAPIALSKRKGGRPKGSKNAVKAEPAETAVQADNKAALLAEMRRPLTADEKRLALAEIEKNRGRDPQLIVNDAVLEVVLPNWATTPSVDGSKHFIVKADRKGERVSFEPEKWKNALALHKLPSGSITFKPEGLGFALGAGMGNETTIKTGNAWRVMIG